MINPSKITGLLSQVGKSVSKISRDLEYQKLYGNKIYASIEKADVAAGAIAKPWDVKTIPLSTRFSDRSTRIGGRRQVDVLRDRPPLPMQDNRNIWQTTDRDLIEQDRRVRDRLNQRRNAQIQTIYSYPPGRPSSNVNPVGGRIPGMEEGGIAAKIRKFFGFGSPFIGAIKKLTQSEILGRVAKKFGKIWEGTEESFLSKVKSGTGVGFKERQELWSDWQLAMLKNLQVEKGGIKPGLQTIHAAAEGNLPDRVFFSYNTATSDVVGAASMYRAPTGEWIRGGLTVKEQFRGKGSRGLASMLSRTLFEHGAVIPDTLSTAGAKSFFRQVQQIAEEAGQISKPTVQDHMMTSMGKVNNAQTRNTVSGISSSLHNSRGIRKGPSGGNG